MKEIPRGWEGAEFQSDRFKWKYDTKWVGWGRVLNQKITDWTEYYLHIIAMLIKLKGVLEVKPIY